MRTFSRLFLFLPIGICVSSAAFARAPDSQAEHSLLYWRYLCREQPQEETILNQVRELKCPVQGWVVRTPASEGKVKEILEHEAP
ncbi:MAG: hypothetical protein H7333_04890 [Bdellovibrionales bacterium]|nr:hypothetical protein [Oligoflexia bacterium]